MATIFNNISPNGENRRLMLIDAWAEDPLTVDMMNHPVNGDKVAVRSHNSLNEIVVDSVKVYDNGSWVDEGGGGVNPSPTGTVVYEGTFSTTESSGVYSSSILNMKAGVEWPEDTSDWPGEINVTYGGQSYVVPFDNYWGGYGETESEARSFTNYPVYIEPLADDDGHYVDLIIYTAAAVTDADISITVDMS